MTKKLNRNLKILDDGALVFFGLGQSPIPQTMDKVQTLDNLTKYVSCHGVSNVFIETAKEFAKHLR